MTSIRHSLHTAARALLSGLLGGLLLAAGHAHAQQPVRGITKDEILIGSLQDLSGPAAGPGKEIRNGMQMRLDEANAQGGIHGRKLRLVIEDHGYDPKRAVLGAQKLIDRDQVFMMVGQFGSATMLATLPLLERAGMVNFFPLSSARQAFEPASPLKYAFHPADYDQIRHALPGLMQARGLKRICAIYQDDELGLEITRGAEAALQAQGLQWTEKMGFKRGSTDFSSQVARAKAADCDGVVLATVVRETVGVMTEARKLGFKPVFVGTSSAYSSAIPRLGGEAVEGLYATMLVEEPYLDSPNGPLREWAARYKARFADDPTVFSGYGYFILDSFVRGVQAAGPALTPASFGQAMDGLRIPPSLFGTPEMRFGPQRRLGNDVARISQIQGGRWVLLKN